MEDISVTRHWVASAGSARSAARAVVRRALRNPRTWTAIGTIWCALGVYLGLSLVHSDLLAIRLVMGLLLALPPMAVGVVVGIVLAYLINLSSFRHRLRAGVELASGFGEDSLVLRSPWAEHRLTYTGLTSAERTGEWVLLRQQASRVVMLWPGQLFGDDDLARLRTAVARLR